MGRNIIYKSCMKCGISKPRFTEFTLVRANSKRGYSDVCKQCSGYYDDVREKTCSKCNQTKSIRDFYVRSAGTLRPDCKTCSNEFKQAKLNPKPIIAKIDDGACPWFSLCEDARPDWKAPNRNQW